MSKDRNAFLIAAVVAALTVPLTVASYVASIEGLPNGVSVGGAFLYFVVALIVVSLAGLFVGLPIVWVLRRRGILNLPALAFAGVISGAAVSWLILSSFPPFIGSISGLAAAITWWLIAERNSEFDA